MKLSHGDKLIGISFYAKGKDKPISVTVGTKEDRPSPLETLGSGGILMDKKAREREEEVLREVHSRPRPLQPQVTIGLGLDRETTTLSREDFEALIDVVDRVRHRINLRDAEAERYERERTAKEAKS